MKKRARPWTSVEQDVLRREYPDANTGALAARLGRTVQTLQQRASLLGVKKSRQFLQKEAQRLREAGRAFHFPKGNIPWSKGTKGKTGGGRARETQFKKKHKPHNYKPVGATRMVMGYQQKKVADPRDWRFVHVMLWEQHNGPIPEGGVLRFRDGDHANITLANLELIDRTENMRRNSIARFPKPVRQVIRLNSKLKRAIDEEQDRGSA